jgi:hypothetical protein
MNFGPPILGIAIFGLEILAAVVALVVDLTTLSLEHCTICEQVFTPTKSGKQATPCILPLG